MSRPVDNPPVVLLLEDEALIGLNLQDEFQDAGFGFAGPFTTCSDALAWLATNRPDVAVLDAVLRDGPCVSVAVELGRRAVPFLVYSGHRADRDLLADCPQLTWIEKPVSSSMLITECKRLLALAA